MHAMITVTKLNDFEIVINSELIEMIESTPDTTITMTTGRKVIVKDTVDCVLDKIYAFKVKIKEGHASNM